MKHRWPSQEWLYEARSLVEATGHNPDDIFQDSFKVNVELGYYEAWEIERDKHDHPVVVNGEYQKHRIREKIPEGFNIVYLP